MPVRVGPRKLVSIALTGGLNFGFHTPEVEEQLGHVEVTGEYPTNFILGANNPIPAHASRRRATGLRSSHCADASIATAKVAGWKVRAKRTKRIASSTRSKAVFVTIGGVKYGWRMPLSTYNALGSDRAVLGIEDATANDVLVIGADYPKPPRAAKEILTGTDYSQRGGFIDPSAVDNLPEGFTMTSAGNYPVIAGPTTP